MVLPSFLFLAFAVFASQLLSPSGGLCGQFQQLPPAVDSVCAGSSGRLLVPLLFGFVLLDFLRDMPRCRIAARVGWAIEHMLIAQHALDAFATLSYGCYPSFFCHPFVMLGGDPYLFFPLDPPFSIAAVG